MAQLMGPGAVGVRVIDDMGVERDLPEDIARQEYPDLFSGQDATPGYADEGAGGYGLGIDPMGAAIFQDYKERQQRMEPEQGDRIMPPGIGNSVVGWSDQEPDIPVGNSLKDSPITPEQQDWALHGGDAPMPSGEFQPNESPYGMQQPSMSGEQAQVPYGMGAGPELMTPEEREFKQSQARQTGAMLQSLGMSQTGFQKVGRYLKPTPYGGPDFAEEREMLEGAVERQRGARQRKVDAETAYMEEMTREGGLIDQHKAYMTSTGKMLQDKVDAQQRAAERMEMEIKQAYRDIPKMDRGRIWKNTSFSAKAAGGIAAAIQGGLNPGQRNTVVDSMLQMVDQDMAAQKVDIATAAQQAASMERGLGRLEARQGIEREMFLKSRWYKLQSIQGDIRKAKMGMQSELNIAKADEALAKIEKEAAKTMGEWTQAAEGNEMRRTQIANEAEFKNWREIESKMRMALARRKARAKKPESALGDRGLIRITGPDGKFYYLGTDKLLNIGDTEYKDTRKELGARAKITVAMRRYLSLLERYGPHYAGAGSRLLNNEQQNELRGAWENARDILLRERTGAQANKSEHAAMDAILGQEPGKYLGHKEMKAMRGYIDTLQKTTEQRFNDLGVDTYDESGALVGKGFNIDPRFQMPGVHGASRDPDREEMIDAAEGAASTIKSGEQAAIDSEAGGEMQAAIGEAIHNLHRYGKGSDEDLADIDRLIDAAKKLPPGQRAVWMVERDKHGRPIMGPAGKPISRPSDMLHELRAMQNPAFWERQDKSLTKEALLEQQKEAAGKLFSGEATYDVLGGIGKKLGF